MRHFVLFLTLVLLSADATSQRFRGTEPHENVIEGIMEEEVNNNDGQRRVKYTKKKKSSYTKKKKSSTKRIIVRYKTNRGRDMALDLASHVFYDFAGRNAIVVELDNTSINALQMLKSDVLAVDEDTPMYPQGHLESSDLHLRRQLQQTTPYGVPMVQADLLNTPDKKFKRVRVCLVDTGVLYSHPDLPLRPMMKGIDRFSTFYQTNLEWTKGVNGHGTCLAGIISSNKTNNIGLRGVGDIPLYITRGMTDQGLCMQSDILDALSQCEASDAQIINLSLGGSSISTTFQEMLDHLYDDAGMLIFGAAGNQGSQTPLYPAAYSKVVSVGALNSSGLRWHASNTGPSLELMAPGDQVWCTGISNGNPTYSLYSGTSMSAPYAAGVAAMVWSYFPSCSNSQIRYALAHTAKDVGASGCDVEYGNGIVQAKAAYDFLASHPCEGASWGSTVSSIGCNIGTS